MRYISTRDTEGRAGKGFSDILLEGLAADGGLYLPESYPQVDAATLETWRELLAHQGYSALAFEIVRLFVDDIPEADLRGIVTRAYDPVKFLDPAVVPVTRLSDGLWLAHLSNGPSAAFKDMAMQLLGELFAYELARRGETITIVGATSGDTGSSAEYALKDKPGVHVFMLSPRGRMTPFQQAQMFSIDDERIVNIAVDGVFDDCQDLVKEINADAAFKARYRIGAVNSINWARLMAQVVYYFAAWLQVSDGGPVSFSVPSGNFGNIAAGHIARQMGLPIHRLILATNENNVLEEFFRTGVYRVRGSAETLATSSPSMDISKASNFERFVFDLLGRDAARLRELFVDDLADGEFDLSGADEFRGQLDRFGFVSGTSTHQDRLAQIRRVYEADKVTIDPHTADAVQVAQTSGVQGPIVVLETALPVKFADTIVEAIGMVPPRPARFDGIEDLPRHVVDLPCDVDALRSLIAERMPEFSGGASEEPGR
ncbi:threonine synthase [Tessaracoccus flavus]|uniref:Threonine synthase n=1 Tax=Tessaracoccus flavus TaxID=1610493 RepID=A0A1Q2CH65_9ACTN|nr:threonine synthase [Tessaracoccus flavus]AQP45454.1 threonine synthase [Tessaracoccus flavus]SDY91861.1 threonine synthase [Tessaracoccus flavus]